MTGQGEGFRNGNEFHDELPGPTLVTSALGLEWLPDKEGWEQGTVNRYDLLQLQHSLTFKKSFSGYQNVS